MAVLVRVPVQERNVLGGDLDIAGAGLGQAPRQQAAQTEAPSICPHICAEPVLGGVEAVARFVAGDVFADILQRLERQVEGLGRRRTEQAIGIVQRAQQRIFLVAAAVLADRAGGQQLLVEPLAALEPAGRHAARRAHALGRLVRERDVEGPILAAQEAGGVEGLELLAFAHVEALADVDERRHGRVQRAERAGDDGAQVRRRDRLRRRIAGMPLILVPRVQDETQVAGGVGADQRAAIHHSGQFSRPCENLILSTAVSMLGKVLRKALGGMPFSNGV